MKAKLKKSDDQSTINKYRVTVNIIEFHIIPKSIFLTTIVPKIMMIRQMFHVKMSKITMFKMDLWIFSSVAAL